MQDRTLLNLLLRAGQLLLESGAETYRAEDAALYMFRRLGAGEISIFAVPTVVIIEIDDGAGHTISGCKRIRRRSIHLGKIEQINQIVRSVTQGELSATDALEALNQLDASKGKNKFYTLLSTAAAAGVFSLLLGGGVWELLFGFVSCFLAQLAGLFFRNVSMYQFFNSILGGLVPTLVMMAINPLLPMVQAETVVVGSMLPLFPGVATVNAIRDAINGDLVSGVSRAAEVVMIAVGLGIGAAGMYMLGGM